MRLAVIGRLEAMIGGIAHHMHQRLIKAIRDDLVDRGFLSFKDKIDLLSGRALQFTHRSAHAVEDVADRNEAQFSGGVLHLAHHQHEPMGGLLEFCQLKSGEVRRANCLRNAQR